MKNSAILCTSVLIFFSCAGATPRHGGNSATMVVAPVDEILQSALVSLFDDNDMRKHPVFGAFYDEEGFTIPEDLSGIIDQKNISYSIEKPFSTLVIKTRLVADRSPLVLAYDILPAGLLDTAIRGFGADKALEGLDPDIRKSLEYPLFGDSPGRYISRIECALRGDDLVLTLYPAAPMPRAVLVEGMPSLAGAGFFLRINTDKDVAESDRERLRSALYEQLLKFRLTPEADETKAVYILDIRMQPLMVQNITSLGNTALVSRRASISCSVLHKARILASRSFTQAGVHVAEQEARNRAIDSAARNAIESLAKEIALKTWVVKEI